jgi:uncharacterized protein (TIGR00299 family) protein
MRIALLDPCAGVAGDMFVGACLDAGAPFEAVQGTIARLGLVRYGVAAEHVVRGGVRATKFRVAHDEDHHHRGLGTILDLLARADLPERVYARAAAAFTRLGEAEAKVHGVPLEAVHFHEVGAIDAICDIVGAAAALDALGVERLHCAPLPLFTGSVQAAHGRIPLPAPATLELMRGRRVYDSGLTGELVTPTGAALVAAWADDGPPPAFTPRAIGYGAGDRDPDGYPNVCRITVGDAEDHRPAALLELICDVDDATPQVLGHLLGTLLEAGALDATLAPVLMKKERPGTRVTVLARTEQAPALEDLLFREGTTLGVRRRAVERTELPREFVTVATRYGPVRVKVGRLGGDAVHVAPEFDDCRARAAEKGVPLRDVMRAALQAWDRR